MYNRSLVAENEETRVEVYNRFSPLPFLLIRGSMAMAGGDLARQIAFSRQLMRLFFLASLVLLFETLQLHSRDKWLALASAVGSMSGFYCIYYSDMIFNDMPALFGCMCVTYVFSRSEAYLRTRGVPLLAAFAALLGWQAVVFAVVGALCLLICNAEKQSRSVAKQTLISSLATAAALLTGLFINEWTVVRGEFAKLNSVGSLLHRTGVRLGPTVWPADFLEQQIARIGLSVSGLARHREGLDGHFLWIGGLVLLVATGGATLLRFGLFRSGRRVWLSLIASGFAWAALVRWFAHFHEFQTVYYVGALAIFFTVPLSLIKWRHASVLASLAAVVLFFAQTISLNQKKYENATLLNRVTADFSRIRDRLPASAPVVVKASRTVPVSKEVELGFHAFNFYLAGHPHAFSRSHHARVGGAKEASRDAPCAADTDELRFKAPFVVTDKRLASGVLLTPRNALYFLYCLTPG